MASRQEFGPSTSSEAYRGGSGALRDYPEVNRGSSGEEIRSNRDAAERHAKNISYSGRVSKLAAVAGDTTVVEGQVVSTAGQLREAANCALDQLAIDVENIQRVAKNLDMADRACASGF